MKGIKIQDAPLTPALTDEARLPMADGTGTIYSTSVQQVRQHIAASIAPDVVNAAKAESQAVMADAMAALNERMDALEKK